MLLPIAFIMCTEGGQLEKESLLMVESFRKFTGSFKNAPIYSFQVRDKNDVSLETQNTLKAFDVNHQKLVLNTKYPNYPFANKPLLCAYAEQTIDAEILVFLDSDLVFFSEPREFLLPLEYDVGIRPEHHKMIGSEGASDSNDEYWQYLYNIANVKDDSLFVTTTVDQKKIRAFWNSGLVAVRKGAGIFTAWRQNLERLIEEGTEINRKNFYYEQSALSATICAKTKNIWCFSPGYNYPIHSHNQMPNSEQLSSLDEIVCIHDHLFRERKEKYRERTWVKTLKQTRNLDKTSSKYQWLYEYLQTHNPKPNLSQGILETIIFLPGVRALLSYKK
ncbi:MAG: hypothetical protein JO235_01100 [Chroococcidiopsidaceae cyanobacterium CP_BM_RX_35]|nr:hypothetical protein [Chroococcidiopsidaceae cyanobacterium CP_BM_RX_35]